MTPPEMAPDVLARYVPRLLLERLERAPERRSGAAPERLLVAALWLDISGFTPLTERFATQGARGAEVITEILNRCFGELIDRVMDSGGDVIDFAGDGLLAVWPAKGPDDLADAVHRAVRCADGIQREMDNFPASEGATLRFYVGVGAGQVSLLEVGGVDDEWRFVVAGDPLMQVTQAKHLCEVGEVVLSREALVLVGGDVATEMRGAGFGVLRGLGSTEGDPETGDDRTPITLPENPELLRSYIVAPVLSRVDAGLTDWLAEFRVASVVFAVVPAPDVDSGPGRDKLVQAVRGAQEHVAKLGGSLNQVMIDDNGLVILMAWGVPGHTHEDDARRAVEASVAIRARLAELGLAARVGVATGRVFCGSYGNRRRQRYALVGAVVNRSARIAMASPSQVQVDETTRGAAQDRLEFVEVEPLQLKGIPQPVSCFRPTGERRTIDASGSGGDSEISGREREREVLGNALRAAVEGHGAPLLLIEGEAGIGKSVLLAHLIREAIHAGQKPLVGAADSVERSTPFYPWRAPFRRLLEVDRDGDPDVERAKVTEIVRRLPGREDQVPLLEPVLGLGFEDNETTEAMAGADRGLAARELLTELLALLGGASPIVILEDLHWFDSASLSLIVALRERVPHALIAAATRPLDGDVWAQMEDLTTAPETIRIPLVEMTGIELLEMVRRTLRVAELPEPLADFLVERGEGHPLFTVELALLLREIGVIEVAEGVCSFDPEDDRLAALHFSDKAHGVVATRIDQLEPSLQVALKIASVLGRSFEYDLLRQVHPIEEDRPLLRQVLEDLTHPHLIEEEQPDPTLAYLFRHVIIREVAYELVAFAQRRQIHAKVARAIEADQDAEDAGSYPLLAHHWLMAEEYAPAIDYLERAGVEALHRGAGREAFRFFNDAFSMSERHRADLPEMTDLRLAEFERQMGEAHEQLVDVPESSKYLEMALKRLNYPTSRAGGTERQSALIKEVAIQLGQILWPAALRLRPRAEAVEKLELAAKAYGTLAEHSYFESDMLGFLLFSLRSVNFAERARTPVAAERSYVALAHSVGLLGLKPLLRRYRHLSKDTKLGRNKALRDIELAGRMLGVGQFEAAAEAGERAALLSRRYSDRHSEAQGWGAVVSAMLRLGRAADATAAGTRIVPTGRLDWAMAAHCAAYLISGEPDGALQRYAELPEWEPAFALGHLVNRALWAEEREEWETAARMADEALEHVEGPGMRNAFTSGHYAMLLTLYSHLYHRTPPADRKGRAQTIERVRRLRTELKKYSRLYPIGRPRVERAAALIAGHEGRPTRAAKHIRRGLRMAERLNMRPETVWLHLEAARTGLPDRDEHLRRAAELCEAHEMHRLMTEVRAEQGRAGEP